MNKVFEGRVYNKKGSRRLYHHYLSWKSYKTHEHIMSKNAKFPNVEADGVYSPVTNAF